MTTVIGEGRGNELGKFIPLKEEDNNYTVEAQILRETKKIV